MMRFVCFLALALAFVAASPPARAENWVPYNGQWFWVDLDSVIRDGSFVTYTLAHGASPGVSPSVGGTLNSGRYAIDCSTREGYSPEVNGGLRATGVVAETSPNYLRFCQSAPPPTASPAPSTLLTSWRIEDMTNAVRRQGGTTDGVRLTYELRIDSQATHANVPYLIAATSAGRRFRIDGAACVADRSHCYGAYFKAEYQFANAEAAQQFVAGRGNTLTHGVERADNIVRAEAYLIFDHGITADNLAFNVSIFMRDVDAAGAAAEQAGASIVVR